MREEIFNMTPREITKLRVINQTIDKVITIKEAADLLNLSERQVIRLKGGVLKEGPAFIIHKNRGRKPSHAVSDDTKTRIISLKSSQLYQEANFNHFQELLKEHEGISISYSTIYRVLTGAGLTSPKKHRKRKMHHRRKRKPKEGMLVQIDASPHTWIIGKEDFSLHGAIDDATGKILALFFTKNECLEGYFQLMGQVINKHGIPLALYCDKHTIFVSPKDGKLSLDEELQGIQVRLTQFGRAMDELGVSIIKAYSPQAKGRIERLWGTLQSRLPVEFKVHGINNIDAANAFLSKFVDRYNERFAVEPEDPESAFNEPDPGLDLDTILCIKNQRVLINGSTFSYGGKYFQLKNTIKASTSHKAKITVLESPVTGIRALYAGRVYETQALEERPKVKGTQKNQKPSKERKRLSPAPDHPWRLSIKERPKLNYEESDREILELLEQLFNSTRAWA
jgi:transposase